MVFLIGQSLNWKQMLLLFKPWFCFRFLKILQIIVEEPGSSFKRFLPSIINICMEHIFPIIAQVCKEESSGI